MISEAILIPKIYARLQEIASNFSKFSGGGPPDPPPALAPSALVSGLRPLTGPPFPNFLDPPLLKYVAALPWEVLEMYFMLYYKICYLKAYHVC